MFFVLKISVRKSHWQIYVSVELLPDYVVKRVRKKKTNGTKMVVTKEKDRLLLTSNLSIVCIPYSKILFLSNFSIFSLFIRKSKSVKMRGAYFHPSVSFFEEIQGDDLSEQ